MLGRNRALVTDLPGTTRDFLEEACDLDGLPVRLTDTAGLRHATGAVEALGVARSREKLAEADAVVLVLDGGSLGEAGAAAAVCPDAAAAEVLAAVGHTPLFAVWNKCDLCLPRVFPPRWLGPHPCCAVSALSGTHMEALAASLRELLLGAAAGDVGEGGLAPTGGRPWLWNMPWRSWNCCGGHPGGPSLRLLRGALGYGGRSSGRGHGVGYARPGAQRHL